MLTHVTIYSLGRLECGQFCTGKSVSTQNFQHVSPAVPKTFRGARAAIATATAAMDTAPTLPPFSRRDSDRVTARLHMHLWKGVVVDVCPSESF